MARLFVIRTGQTTWEAEQRVASAAGAPLTETGAEQVRTVAEQLALRKIDAIYVSGAESERQTAAIVAEVLGVRIRTNKKLCELDFGLWQGLKLSEIKRRQPKVYRQWLEEPASVRPPHGETLADAQKRIGDAIETICRHYKDQVLLLVLRPVALALTCCMLDGERIDKIWEHTNGDFTFTMYDMEAGVIT